MLLCVHAERREPSEKEHGKKKMQTNADNDPQHHKEMGQKKDEWLGPHDGPR